MPRQTCYWCKTETYDLVFETERPQCRKCAPLDDLGCAEMPDTERFVLIQQVILQTLAVKPMIYPHLMDRCVMNRLLEYYDRGAWDNCLIRYGRVFFDALQDLKDRDLIFHAEAAKASHLHPKLGLTELGKMINLGEYCRKRS